MPEPSILALLDAALAADAEATAVIYRGVHRSFCWLDRRSNGFAAALVAAGLAPGERMLLCLQNVPEFLVALLGAAKAGVVTVPVNPMYRRPEIERIVADCEPAAVVCELVHADAFDTSVRFTVGDGGSFPQTEIAERPVKGPADPLMLVYTSGTTGRPKGAVISHANLLAGAEFYRSQADLQAGEPILAAAPLFHVTGLSGHIGAALAAGAPLILSYRFQADEMLDLIERERPVFCVAAITALGALIDAPTFNPARVTSLRTVFSGGAPVAPAMRDRFRMATGLTLRNVYGLTETVAPVIACPSAPDAPVDPATGALAVGRAVRGVTVAVIGEEGAVCPVGEAGEIVVTGPSVVSAYWRSPQATQEAMGALGFRTGDIGVRDADGWIYLIDRKKDMIVASGFKVWPREVEDTLYQHPAVREAAVVGVPDSYRGETVKAVVVLSAGAALSADDLEQFCRKRLAAYKVPRIIEFRDGLPKTATGKILRRELRS
jgi:long-chain acyl-CoA synthetase